MKANELMIGDWVKIKDLKDPIKRISCIDEYLRMVDFGDDERLIATSINNVLPIPLTCSVLEKIGFEEMMNEGEEVAKRYGRVPHPTGVWQLGLSDFDCVMYVPKDDFLRIKFMMEGQTDLRYIRFVHELQHALRLCGIEKEIEL